MAEDKQNKRERWFLTPAERGNPHSEIDSRRGDALAYTIGNRVEPLIHGATYFRRLLEEIQGLDADDWVHFTDWRGDSDERLVGPGTEVAKVLAAAATRGVHVRGLVWRSHPDQAKFSEQENLHLVETVNEAGGEVLLDERVRRGGSHHQKLFLIRHLDDEDRDVAFVGGIDLCYSRRDDERHQGDDQVYEMNEAYGPRPPWHDVQIEVHGPAVGDLATTFRERWEDPTPLDHRNPWRLAQMKRARQPRKPDPLPAMPKDPAPAGDQAVQVLRTYPHKKGRKYPFAPDGERSIARAYTKALKRARRLIYVEDQYFWSEEVSKSLADALTTTPDLHLIAVVPRFPEQEGYLTETPERIGQQKAIDIVKAAGGDRVAFYDIENEAGTPIYVHAKVCVIDDVWALVGSDNLNRRSWTHDSELSCAILDDELDGRQPADPAELGDGARRFARDLRLTLSREHLGEDVTDDELLDPAGAVAAFARSAQALAGWKRSRDGDRPSSRVLVHDPRRIGRAAALWAYPVYRAAVDPDGRPKELRRSGGF